MLKQLDFSHGLSMSQVARLFPLGQGLQIPSRFSNFGGGSESHRQTGEEGLLNLVLAIAFKSGLFQHLSVLLLKRKDYQSFASLVLPEGSPGARRRPASGRGPHLSINPPTHSPTQPSTHPPPSPSSCLAQFGSPGLTAARAGRGSVVWRAPGTGPVLPRG